MLPLPPEPDHFTAGDLVGVANIIADVDTYLSVEACARAVLERAVRDGLVRGVVPAPPPDRDFLITVCQRLAGDLNELRATFPEPFEGAALTPVELALGRVEQVFAELERVVRWPGRVVPAPQEGPPTVICAVCSKTLPTSIPYQPGELLLIGPHECPAIPAPQEPKEKL